MSSKATMPFPTSEVQQWITAGTRDCGIDPNLHSSLGGTAFNIRDKSTYWTQPSQFFTWWKNNVERRSKFQSLVNDSRYYGRDFQDSQRALYCKSVIALTTHIKSHLSKNKGVALSLTPLPLPPPTPKKSSISPVVKAGRPPSKASGKTSFTSIHDLVHEEDVKTEQEEDFVDDKMFCPIKGEGSLSLAEIYQTPIVVPKPRYGKYKLDIFSDHENSENILKRKYCDDQQQTNLSDEAFRFEFSEEDEEIGIIFRKRSNSMSSEKADNISTEPLVSATARFSEDCEASFSDSISAYENISLFSFEDLCSIVQSFGASDIKDVNIEPLFRIDDQIDVRDGVDLLDCFSDCVDVTDYSIRKRHRIAQPVFNFDLLADQVWI